MAHLITSSLLDGFAWLQDCPASWKAKANEEFIGTIRRCKTWQPTPEAQRGMDFEALICQNCNTYDEPEFMAVMQEHFMRQLEADTSVAENDRINYWKRISDVCRTFYAECKGGEQQVKVAKELEVFGENYLVFGYADIVHPHAVLDIKTTTKYKDASKYLKRAQHHAYVYALGINKFEYIVADYRNTKYPLNIERIDASSTPDASASVLKGRIHNMVTYIKRYNLWDDYVTLFSKGK